MSSRLEQNPVNPAETHRCFSAGITCVLCAGITATTLAEAHPQPNPGNVFRAGETAVIQLSFSGKERKENKDFADSASFAAKSQWSVLDVDGATLAEGEADDDVLPLPHSALGGRFGAFTLRSWRKDVAITNETRFAFLPPGDVRPCHWVGTQFHYGRAAWGLGDKRLLDLAAAAGIGIVRDEPGWASCEKAPGQYATSPILEELADGLAARGMGFCCLLTYDNPTAYPDNPLDADAFARWAAWMADYMKGRCDTFEIWNEPHNFRF